MVFHSIVAGQIDSLDITQARCLASHAQCPVTFRRVTSLPFQLGLLVFDWGRVEVVLSVQARGWGWTALDEAHVFQGTWHSVV